MNKIALPEKQKCGRCSGNGEYAVGPLYRRRMEKCDCDNGYRYVFDEVAAAVLKDGNYTYGVWDILLDDKTIAHEAIMEWVGTDFGDKPESGEDIWIARGPTPTAALVAAVKKVNGGQGE